MMPDLAEAQAAVSEGESTQEDEAGETAAAPLGVVEALAVIGFGPPEDFLLWLSPVSEEQGEAATSLLWTLVTPLP